MERVTVILSGGLDSTTALYRAVEEFGSDNTQAITFDYGQRHNKEINYAEEHCVNLGVKHTVLDMSVIGKSIFSGALMDADEHLPTGEYGDDNLEATVVPNRNMIMISLAAAAAIKFESNTVWYGAHAGDHANYPDCRPEFYNALAKVLQVCHFEPIKLEAPFLTYHKSDIVAAGLALNVPYERTWSCYDGGEEACGVCTTCDDRLRAFSENNAIDPVPYKGQ